MSPKGSRDLVPQAAFEAVLAEREARDKRTAEDRAPLDSIRADLAAAYPAFEKHFAERLKEVERQREEAIQVKTQPMYRCEKHGLLPRMSTHLGFKEPVGGRLECGFCSAFVAEVEIVPLSEVKEALLELVEDFRSEGKALREAAGEETPASIVWWEAKARLEDKLAAFPSTDSEG